MKKQVAVWWVPHMLFPMQNHTELCQKQLTRYKKEEIVFLQRIIAINETLVHDFKPELKSQCEVWKGKNSPRLQKFQHQASKVKQMIIMTYEYTGVIAPYMVPYGCTVDQHVYVHFFCNIL